VLQVEEAEHSLPEAANGVFMITSSEQFDALVKVNANRTVVLLAGLSWCRPCKGLTRPVEKMAKHYADGAVFAKILGDHSDNTKRFFKNVLEVRGSCCDRLQQCWKSHLALAPSMTCHVYSMLVCSAPDLAQDNP